MALVKKHNTARRLARTTIMDILMRNPAKLDAGVDASAEIAEARELFVSKTITSLHPVFEEELRAMELARYAAASKESEAATASRPEWREVRDGELGSVITFNGIDLDEQAEIEIENFARAVNTPEKDDPDLVAREGTNLFTPMNGLSVGLGCFVAFVGYEAFDGRGPIAVAGWNSPAGAVAMLLVIVLGIAGGLLPTIVVRIRTRRARPRARSTRYAFRLGLSPEQFIVERAGFRLAIETREIDRFEGGERLSVLRRDGTTLVLPCGLKSRAHASLAVRLNELLREYHGYRG